MNKIFSVFVKHPLGIDTKVIEELLRTCGPLLAWKPQMDPNSGRPKNFGFADYADISGIARAVRVLSPIQLPENGNPQSMQPMIVKVDKSTTGLLEIYNRSNIVNLSEDEVAKQKVDEILQTLFGDISDSSSKIAPVDTVTEFLSSVLPPPVNDHVVGSNVNSKTLYDTPNGNNHHHHHHNNNNHDNNNNNGFHNDRHGQLGDRFVSEDFDEEDGMEAVKKRQERKKHDQQRAFEERLARFKSRQIYRSRMRAEHKRKDEQFNGNIENVKENEMKYYQNYDDDLEEKKNEDDWYADRDKWIEKRKPFRSKEAMLDDKDRSAEQRQVEKAEKKERAEEEEKVKLEGSIRLSELKNHLKTLLKSPSFSWLHPLSDKQISTDELFQLDIDWSLLTQEAIKKRIIPLIDAKITQFLGESEPDLVEFVTDTILPISTTCTPEGEKILPQLGKNAVDILEEISTAFGDSEEEKKEALDMVVSVWKAVVWEVEKQKFTMGRNVIGLEDDSMTLEDVDINHVAI